MENSINYKFIVYMTINKKNHKFYIGVHKTNTPWIFDGYLGCGAKISSPSSYNKGKTPLHAAILKYGISNFKRITLAVFNTVDEALNLEKILVTEEFIKNSNNYNITLGGGLPPDSSKSINQFDLQGNFIKTWKNSQEINNFYGTKISLNEIIKNKKQFANYFWTYSNIKSINLDDYKIIVKGGFINRYDKYGNYISTYKSILIASQQLDIKYEKLRRAVHSKKLCEGCYYLKAGIDILEVISNSFKRTYNH